MLLTFALMHDYPNIVVHKLPSSHFMHLNWTNELKRKYIYFLNFKFTFLTIVSVCSLYWNESLAMSKTLNARNSINFLCACKKKEKFSSSSSSSKITKPHCVWIISHSVQNIPFNPPSSGYSHYSALCIHSSIHFFNFISK